MATSNGLFEADDEMPASILSSNLQERVQARRERLQRRLENIRRLNLANQGMDESATGVGYRDELKDQTEVQKQLEKSAEIIEKVILESEEIITNVRVANDGREVDRRENEGMVREKIIEQLEEEAEAAQEMFNEVANRWSQIYKYSDPLAIHEELMAQKEKCDELIRQKDGIVAMLKEDIKRTELQYSEDQDKQNEDIATLTHRIENQVSLLRKAYASELEMMETAINLERKLLTEVNNKKWEDLYESRDQLEQSNIQMRYDNDKKHIRNMIQLRVDHEESYRKTRIQLEKDLNSLEQELEVIKAMCLLNSEKLDYNYQILAKREDENLIIKSQQKRRINKLSDMVNLYKTKIREFAQQSSVEAARLKEQVLSLRRGVKDTERKLLYFSQSNDMKYQKIWQLNFGDAEKLLNRILNADRIIYEQHLGREWKEPQVTLLEKRDMPTYRHAARLLGIKLPGSTIMKRRSSTAMPSEDLKPHTQSIGAIYEMHKNNLLQHILKLISDKSGFLVENRLKTILRQYESDPRYLIRIDCLFAALGVCSKPDIDDLIEFFLPYTECKLCLLEPSTESLDDKEIKVEFFNSTDEVCGDVQSDLYVQMKDAMSAVQEAPDTIENILLQLLPSMEPPKEEEEEEPDDKRGRDSVDSRQSLKLSVVRAAGMRITCHKHHPLVVKPGFVLKALSDFIINYYQVHGLTQPPAFDGVSSKNATISRLLSDEDVTMFWNRFKEVYNPGKEQLWNGLLCGMQKYLDILKDRRKMNDEVVSLRRQNKELKHLLATYIEKLKKQKPPCQLPSERLF